MSKMEHSKGTAHTTNCQVNFDCLPGNASEIGTNPFVICFVHMLTQRVQILHLN